MQGPAPQTAIIEFNGLLVIVGGGSVNLGVLHELNDSGGRLVGADGGADVIADAGLKPEAIIGDFDSLRDRTAWLGRTRLVHIAEQETTDFEKALYSTRAPVTVALGMTGRRFDHSLAALDAVTRHASGRRIILVDEDDVALALTGSFAFAVEAGERVSVHPLVPVTFRHSKGLRYPLDGLTLAPGVRTGTSNLALSGPFSIEPVTAKGEPYLVILDRRHLMPLVTHLIGQ